MRVKRYVVDSMPDALQQIRSDLGKDAVILNTKEIRSGGFLGLFSKKKIEVIAATDTAVGKEGNNRARADNRVVSGTAVSAVNPRAHSSGTAVMDYPAVPEDRKEIPAALSELLGALTSKGEERPAPAPTVSRPQGIAAYGGGAKPPTAESSPTAGRLQEDPILQELRDMKQWMQRLSSGVSGGGSSQDPLLAELGQRLTDQEIRPDIVQSILAAIEDQVAETGETLTKEFAERSARDQLRLLLRKNSRKTLSEDTRIAHFVGPTGVGKTTTIAKLAAEQVLKYKRKVGLITSDTYRIAAVDQLKTYATILGIPLEVVFSPLDLKKAFEQFKDRDVIFMDTAGRNFRNEMYVSELNALLQSGGKSETFLVLSLTTKYKDMKAIADNFSRFKLDKVLFTKRDETETFGSIVNLLHDFPLELSYITTGQNVPDDFATADESEIIDLILEEQPDE